MNKKIWRGYMSDKTPNQYVAEDSEGDANATVVPDAACFPVKEAKELCKAQVALHQAEYGGGYKRALQLCVEQATNNYIQAVQKYLKKTT